MGALEVRLHPRAEDDLVDVWAWYESRGDGLGDDFLAAVRVAVEALVQWPESGTDE